MRAGCFSASNTSSVAGVGKNSGAHAVFNHKTGRDVKERSHVENLLARQTACHCEKAPVDCAPCPVHTPDLLDVDLPRYAVVHSAVVDLYGQVSALVESSELRVRRVRTRGERLSKRTNRAEQHPDRGQNDARAYVSLLVGFSRTQLYRK